MSKNSYNELVEVLTAYKRIPKQIKLKQKMLEIKLCDPTISAYKGFQAFTMLENEIDYMQSVSIFIEKLIKSFNYVDRQIIEGLINCSNIEILSDRIGLDKRTVFRHIKNISLKFKNSLTTENIYNSDYKFEEDKELGEN